MKQPEDRFTIELQLPTKPATGGGMRSLSELLKDRDSLDRSLRQQGIKRGPYKGAIKLGSPHHAIRVMTGMNQADFATIAGISERSLRTWEAGTPESVNQVTHDRIVRALALRSVDYLAAMAPYRRKREGSVRYRNRMTGETWSGKGLMPKWLRVALDQPGATLADFDTTAPQRKVIVAEAKPGRFFVSVNGDNAAGPFRSRGEAMSYGMRV